jgi:hypothetical protein
MTWKLQKVSRTPEPVCVLDLSWKCDNFPARFHLNCQEFIKLGLEFVTRYSIECFGIESITIMVEGRKKVLWFLPSLFAPDTFSVGRHRYNGQPLLPVFAHSPGGYLRPSVRSFPSSSLQQHQQQQQHHCQHQLFDSLIHSSTASVLQSISS